MSEVSESLLRAAMKDQHRDMKAEIDALSAQVALSDTRIASLQASLDAAQAQLAAVTRERDEATARLNAIIPSCEDWEARERDAERWRFIQSRAWVQMGAGYCEYSTFEASEKNRAFRGSEIDAAIEQRRAAASAGGHLGEVYIPTKTPSAEAPDAMCLARKVGTDEPLTRCAQYPRCPCGGPEGWPTSVSAGESRED